MQGSCHGPPHAPSGTVMTFQQLIRNQFGRPIRLRRLVAARQDDGRLRGLPAQAADKPGWAGTQRGRIAAIALQVLV